MAPKTKQKQSQKQEQNVKVVINQDGNKSKKAKSKKRQQRPKQTQPTGPIPYGYSPLQTMRTYQTYTPQISNNTVPDFNNVINALRTSIMGTVKQPIPSEISTTMKEPIEIKRQSMASDAMNSPRTVFGTRQTPAKVDRIQQTQSDGYIDLRDPVIFNTEYKPRPVRFSKPIERDIMPSYPYEQDVSPLGSEIKQDKSPEPPAIPSSIQPIRTSDIGTLLNTPAKKLRTGGYVFNDLDDDSIPATSPSQSIDLSRSMGSEMIPYTGFPVSSIDYKPLESHSKKLRSSLTGYEEAGMDFKLPDIQQDYKIDSSLVYADDNIEQANLQGAKTNAKDDSNEGTMPSVEPNISNVTLRALNKVPRTKSGAPDRRFLVNKGTTLNLL